MIIIDDYKNEVVKSGDYDSLKQQVYDRIRTAIQEKSLKPGEKINLGEWAARLNMSRTPVRDAINRLEHEGLVIRESERQWHVYLLNLEEVEKIFDARIGIDGEIAYLAAQNITDEQLKELRQILIESEETRILNDYELYHAVDEKFHQLMNRASNNEYLTGFQQQLIGKLGRLYPTGLNIGNRLEASIDENKLISEALFAREPEKAKEYQLAHLSSYREHLLLVLKKLVIPYTGSSF